MSKILIVEDEASIRRVLVKILSEEDKSHEIYEAEDGLIALNKIKKENFDLVLCDIKMPKMDGIEVLEFTKKIKPEIPIVMISGHGDLDTAVDSMRKGAYDYISKPPDLNRLLNTVRNAIDKKNLTLENTLLKRKIISSFEMIGESKELNKIRDLIKKVAITDAKILITGPNGAGKELVARSIHSTSNRAHNPLIEVNCAAIPSELIESELFGHVKGSFTGAIKDKTGKFEAANNGTIFLDEVGDMSLSAQAKVLRVLQDNCIQKVGGGKDIKIDVRVIAATNKDLKKEIEKGKFREDLFHRLAVIIINVPSLKERRNDIPLLINYFSTNISKAQGTKEKKFSKSAVKLLKSMNWTGNVRELRNVVERLIILGDEKEISEKNVKQFAK
ncbi:MAG: sigma-54 dependent transcriptional regulator [Flavobacteriaceae bacterium]|jgi:DNA-binding NtrC family response regulator|nr:sigma-54-dependent Fis family transcriptional regulator [Pelagibacterales bacterium]MDG2173950.1 sigma-54 dependent transcriptional regulator [Flavobacteriaceae bacterium]